MRILAMTNLYPNPWQPHRAPFNRNQFRILNDHHPVRVIAPISWIDERTALRKNGSPLPANRRVSLDGLTVDHPRYWFPPKVGRRWYGHCYRHSVRKAFRAALEEFQPDLVFAPWAYPDGWAAVRLGHAAGLPVVIQCHGSDVLLLDRYPSRRKRTTEAITLADGVVAVSRDIAGRLQTLGALPDRVRVIHDGVDLTLFKPGSKEESRRRIGWIRQNPLVLFIGNLVAVKAIDVLLDALAQLGGRGEAIDLVIIGDGPLRSDLGTRAAALGLRERVVFRGSVPQTDLPMWYRSADLLVLPSHSEGVPNVLLEASACGTPWVASRVGGIPEIAHLGVNTLVPPAAPGELAQAIQSMLAAPPGGPGVSPKPREEAVSELIEFLAERLHCFLAGAR
jgi:glycosyltransferase involved in cell wall biosynthesis